MGDHVNPLNVESFIANHPILFHMADAGAWPKIRFEGLLSTSALLDRYGVTGERRHRLGSCRRGRREFIEHRGTRAVARLHDNRPIRESILRDHLLLPGTSVEDWYRLLNRHVFFWVSESSLRTFMKTYSQGEHDVISVSTRRLLARDYDRVTITPMNTGSASWCTELPRGSDIFTPRIHEFDLAAWDVLTPPNRDTIVELAVDYAVEDIEAVAVRSTRRSWLSPSRTLWESPDPTV
jgi:hypothetical protein